MLLLLLLPQDLETQGPIHFLCFLRRLAYFPAQALGLCVLAGEAVGTPAGSAHLAQHLFSVL